MYTDYKKAMLEILTLKESLDRDIVKAQSKANDMYVIFSELFYEQNEKFEMLKDEIDEMKRHLGLE